MGRAVTIGGLLVMRVWDDASRDRTNTVRVVARLDDHVQDHGEDDREHHRDHDRGQAADAETLMLDAFHA